jgi:UDP-glucose 4-epimerase
VDGQAVVTATGGDVIAIYSDNTLVKQHLGWQPRYSMEDMLFTAWKWEQKLKADESFYSKKPAGLN